MLSLLYVLSLLCMLSLLQGTGLTCKLRQTRLPGNVRALNCLSRGTLLA